MHFYTLKGWIKQCAVSVSLKAITSSRRIDDASGSQRMDETKDLSLVNQGDIQWIIF